PGKSRALNAAVAASSHADVCLFTDDDVRFPPHWVSGMCGPILAGRADAVAGGVRLAPHLLRAWMEPLHRSWLASTEMMDPADPQNMVGANMAVSRRVFERVPQFDPALGPAGTGAGEDLLFSWQLKRAGYRVAAALDVAVEHHFQPHRLGRPHFLRMAENRGRTSAYLAHHWVHEPPLGTRWRCLRQNLRLALHRARRRRRWPHTEGMPEWEMVMVEQLWHFRQSLVERCRPKRHDHRGLAPVRSDEGGAASDAVPSTT
ncbi:MAG TPA: glycosyltransferase, partial [Humisphaera sp.]